MGSTLKGKNLLLKEHLSEMGRGGGGGGVGGGKNENKRVATPERVPIHLNICCFFHGKEKQKS